MIFFTFTLIVFNFLYSPMNTTHEKQHGKMISTFDDKQLAFTLNNDLNAPGKKRMISEELKRQVWVKIQEDLKINAKGKLNEKEKRKENAKFKYEIISTFNIKQLEFLLNNDLNTPTIRRLFLTEELDRQLLEVEKEKLVKEKIKVKKSIWLIRHGEKDGTMTTYFMDTFKELNYKWPLSDRGLVQSHRVATVLKNHYKNFENPPLIFVSPFQRTIHTGLYVANAVKSKIQIEEGLLEKRHGLWNQITMFDYFSKHLKFFNTAYKSKFRATNDRISPISAYNVTRCEISEKDRDFDENVANYFEKMLREGKQDIIIIGHQTELYNIQRVFTGSHRSRGNIRTCEKIKCASMFQYVLNPISSQLELKSIY